MSALDLTNSDLKTIVDDGLARLIEREGIRLRLSPQGYAAYGHAGLLHRLATHAPRGFVVDHLNGDKLDNRCANLRVTDQTVNGFNRTRRNRNNTSGSTGVSWSSSRGKWVAQAHYRGRALHLGMFPDISTATAARDAFLIEKGLA